MKKVKFFFKKAIYQPYFALFLALIFLLVNLILDGTLFRVFRLNRSLRIVQNRIEHIEKKISDIEHKIKQSSDPSFVEKEARERLDYANEGDLIFLFPENL